ncbi:MAG: 50S ribosomal protein L3 [Candidatus Abyssobacteria bacterium SURF_5]|uniref:Large ribosomal subunit protein uL3 n=1 Tax=Abyssobacteria bacterium (strain SURF_5) TaxID=2093360 RepID=A0A3A4NGZ8_ABYX5|nr:MAG: 50S ribosomal protein L3 [Candidatus Abyssubacteria bacterium SURF_5]
MVRKGKVVFGLLGKKIGMSQVFTEEGNLVPVTVLEVGPCAVTQLKNNERDGYEAVQLGFAEKKRNVTKPLQGHFKRAGVSSRRHLREFSLSPSVELKEGAEVRADVFTAGDLVDVSGTTKGRGFAGVVRRYKFGGGPASHGHTSHRRVGSIGQCADTSEVWKGKGMPGHMGAVRRTIQNLKVVKVDGEKNLLLVQGAVPGPNGGMIEIRSAIKGSGKAVKGKS